MSDDGHTTQSQTCQQFTNNFLLTSLTNVNLQTMVLAKLLEELIAQSGLTQQEVEKRANLSRGYISKILSGERKSLQSKTQTRLAQALGVPRSALDIDLPEADRSTTPAVAQPSQVVGQAHLGVSHAGVVSPVMAVLPIQHSTSRSVVVAQLQNIYPNEVLAALERLDVPTPDPGEDYWLEQARRLDDKRTEIEEARRRARLERDRVELDLAERHRQLVFREEDASQVPPKVATLQDQASWFELMRRTLKKFKGIRLSSLFAVGANKGWSNPSVLTEDDLARLARQWEETTSAEEQDEAELALVSRLVAERTQHAEELKRKGIVGADLILAMRRFDKEKRFEAVDSTTDERALSPTDSPRPLRPTTSKKKH